MNKILKVPVLMKLTLQWEKGQTVNLKTWTTLIKGFIYEKTGKMLAMEKETMRQGERKSWWQTVLESFCFTQMDKKGLIYLLKNPEGREGASHSDTWENISLTWKEQQMQRHADGTGLMKDKQPGRQSSQRGMDKHESDRDKIREVATGMGHEGQNLYIIMKHLFFTLNKLGRF